MATFSVDKTVLVVAITRFLNETNDHWLREGDFKRLLDILTGSKAHLIGERVSVDDFEFEILEPFLEEV